MIKAEFHTHTRFSHDSAMGRLAYLIMLKIKGVKAVAVTDHNTAEGALYLKPFLEKHGIKVIIGEEIFTSRGEIIGLFLKETVKPGMTPEKTAEAIKSQGGLIYVPHPYDEKRRATVLAEDAIEALKNSIDLIEIHNGRNAKREFSEKQEEIALKYGITPIIGSDAHTFFELGRNYVVMEDFSGPGQMMENIKKAEFVRKDCIRAAHAATRAVRLFKLALSGRFDEIYGIIKRKFGI